MQRRTATLYILLVCALGLAALVLAFLRAPDGESSGSSPGAEPPFEGWRREDSDGEENGDAPGLEELRQEVREIAGRLVVEGYRTEDEILELSVELAMESEVGSEFESEQITSVTAAVLPALWTEQRERERGWTGPTDCDRLSRAFEAMEQAGIVARENFGETQSDGVLRMLQEELPRVRSSGRSVRGFAFFHEADDRKCCRGRRSHSRVRRRGARSRSE